MVGQKKTKEKTKKEVPFYNFLQEVQTRARAQKLFILGTLVDVLPTEVGKIVVDYLKELVLIGKTNYNSLCFFDHGAKEPKWEFPKTPIYVHHTLTQFSSSSVFIRYRNNPNVSLLFTNEIWTSTTNTTRRLCLEPRWLDFSHTCVLQNQIFAVVTRQTVVTINTNAMDEEWHAVHNLPRLDKDEIQDSLGACANPDNGRVYVLVTRNTHGWLRRIKGVLVQLLSFSANSPVDGWRSHAATCQCIYGSSPLIYYNSQLWLIGGMTVRSDPSCKTVCYSIQKDQWQDGPELNDLHAQPATFVLDGQLFVIGTANQPAECLNTKTNQWELVPGLTPPDLLSNVVSIII